jgi:hypothetical protein
LVAQLLFNPFLKTWGDPMKSKLAILALVLVCLCGPAFADEVTQFGVIYSADLQIGTPFLNGEGVTTQTFVVVNLGNTDLNFADLVFSSSLVSTTASVTPDVSVDNNFPGNPRGPASVPNSVLHPGQAYGYINGDYIRQPTLSYVQSIFPSATSLTISQFGASTLEANFANPPGSGITFNDVSAVVDYTLTIDGATAEWTGSFEDAIPGELPPGQTSGTVGFTESNVVTPEPNTLLLLGIGSLALRVWSRRAHG